MHLKIAAFCALLATLGSVACGGASHSPAQRTSTPAITVLHGAETIGRYATAGEAFAKASELAGFQVVEAHELPPGEAIDSINVLNPPAASAASPRQVQVGVRGASGGLLITELNTRTTLGNDATRLTSQRPGEFYIAGTGSTKSYVRLTDNRTYTLASPNAALSDAEAINVLASLR